MRRDYRNSREEKADYAALKKLLAQKQIVAHLTNLADIALEVSCDPKKI